MLLPLTWTSWGLCLAILLQGGDAKPSKPTAVTRVSEADEDFAIQGEYTGTLVWQGCWQPVGLQVVALGSGKFQALLYPGGLPGNGYNGATKTELKGQRDGAAATLSGEGVQVRLQAGLAVTVSNAAGGHLGYLQPMHRYSSTQGARPPAHAKVLFNGTDTGLLKNVQISEEGLLQIGAETVDPVGDFYLHGEFKTPYMPAALGQARGNSGFYLQRRYEVQVLDSFGLEPAFNEAASLYRFKSPDMNMSFPPLSWQTYDIQFTSARFNDAGEKIAKARITVWHNGVVVQNNVELDNKTGGGRPESPELLPILLQNHGNPVEFRNLWLVDTTPAPVTATAGCVTTCVPSTPATCCQPCGQRSKGLGLFRRSR